MMSLFDEMHLKLGTLVAGFLGSLASINYEKPISIWESLIRLSTGVTTAGYLSPVIGEIVELSESMESGLGFLVGLTSMNIVAAAFMYSKKIAEDPKAFFDKLRKK